MTHHDGDDAGSVGTIDRVREEDILLYRAMGGPSRGDVAPAASRSDPSHAVGTVDDGLFWPIASIAITTFGTLLYHEHNRLMSDQRVHAKTDRDHMQQTLQKSRAMTAMTAMNLQK
jgi:hypothetical protein